jgi:hypothetical protein
VKKINIVVGKDSWKVHNYAVKISDNRNCGDYKFDNNLCVSVPDYYEHDIMKIEEEISKIRDGRETEVSDDIVLHYIH